MGHIYDKFIAWLKKPRGLLAAAAAGDTDAVLLFLDRGCNIEQSWQCTTALTQAAEGGHVATVQALLDRGAKVNPALGWDWDSLGDAIRGGSVQVVQMFLDRGADIDAKDPEYRVTSLMRAAESGSIEIVSLLLERRADVNELDSDGRTALTYARQYHHHNIVDLLTRLGGKETEDWVGVP